MAQFKGKYRVRAREIQDSTEYKFASAANKIAIEVNNRLEQLGISRTELAKRLGVARSAVTQMLSSSLNPKLSTLVKLSEALELELNIGFGEAVTDTADLEMTVPPVRFVSTIEDTGCAACRAFRVTTVLNDTNSAFSLLLLPETDNPERAVAPMPQSFGCEEEREEACV